MTRRPGPPIWGAGAVSGPWGRRPVAVSSCVSGPSPPGAGSVDHRPPGGPGPSPWGRGRGRGPPLLVWGAGAGAV